MERHNLYQEHSPESTAAVVDLTEEEQVEIALIESAQDSLSQHPDDSPYGLVKAIEPMDYKEPENAPDTTRIQLRLPDGSKLVKRFYKNDLVRKIVAYLKHLHPDYQEHPIDVRLYDFYELVGVY
jgi:hypothetical protein